MHMILWKGLLSIISIFPSNQFLVYCIPTSEVYSNDNKQQGSWSGLSDILEINDFDSEWHNEAQSGHNKEGRDVQIGESITHATKVNGKKPKQRRSRNTPEHRAKRKLYREKLKSIFEKDPVAQQVYREKKNKANRKWKAKKISKMTEIEKEALFMRKKRTKKQWEKLYNERCGGFSSPKQQRLNMIRKMKAEGTANEADLKFLHEYQEEQKQRKRKSRAAQKGGI
ncbi:uncharacterized protein FA14DRAFT_152122 [Meira miltonrushii]|uniref:Ribosomal RNA-processing protein 14/surfeit locus protein 6 C-terminal domain-containing protein n=1 Tax=Meira miltonrushii TaxID=1280837 RepID=A0A316VHH0_9BASI|nr:uncharacterized protein FA14DRAFT_152122 [Meira miltonrushii]PWN36694.1 hypothetical protein FA14DRAFT_152122 [Meira miltonrushii]